MNFMFKSLAVLCLMAVVASFASLAQAQTSSSDERSSTRIVGGYEAKAGSWPWMASLVLSYSHPSSGQFCGGALIHPNWVVTAGHCANGYTASDISVWMGVHERSDTTGAESFAVKNIIMNPDYHLINGYPDQDIALLELEESAHYPVLPLVDQDDPQGLTAVGTMATVTGWGRLSYGGVKPDALQEVQVPIMSQQAGIEGYGAENVTDAMLVAGYDEGTMDACQGDSGGPLMVPTSERTGWALAGLVSWGIGCAEAGHPGMYTRISEFTDWVRNYVPDEAPYYAYEGYIPYVSYATTEYTGVAFSNLPNVTANQAQVDFYSNDGTELDSVSVDLQAHAQTSFGVEQSAVHEAGWARLRSYRPMRGLSMIAGPEELPMYDVDMQDSVSPSVLAAHLDLTEGRWESTLMACNPSDSEITLSFALYDTDGEQVPLPDTPTWDIPAMGAEQISINELFPDHSATGSLKVTATGDGVAAFLLYDATQGDTPYPWRAGLSVMPE